MKKVINDKIFKINDSAEVRCSWFATRYGFKHEAELYVDGIFQCSAKVCYYNRTWESFEYETVADSVLRKSKLFTIAEINTCRSQWQRNSVAELNRSFGLLAGIAKMGELLTDNQKAANDWKERMLKAGLTGLDMPENWDNLTEEERTKRLDAVIAHLTKVVE